MKLATLQKMFIDDVRAGTRRVARFISSPQRLSIYQNGYQGRLVDAIRANYPKTCAALGGEKFLSACARYIKKHSATSYNLNDYGVAFAQFLGKSHKLYHLALLEALTTECFNSPEEEHPAVDFAAIVAEKTRFVFQPNVRLLESGTLESKLIYKRNHAICIATLPPASFKIMKRLIKGQTIDRALQGSKAQPREIEKLFQLLANPGVTLRVKM